ncbi:MAG: Acyl-[acyl-carrier-protein]--UDP-N-acetylglucosamine O-acyltransferase [Chlamydiia bacterium]|nr:Acyl-[acyl-carrier-protein]--UDP-N-acetylglucosamine O-acyltransferase [Chlamydiia bacterium]
MQHPTAIVEPTVKIGKNVEIEPYAVIKGNVELKDNVTVKSHAHIEGNTTIGRGTTIFPFASIGTVTQDLKFAGEETFIDIGENCSIRECVTINGSCGEGTRVSVGNQCLIMAYCHIAHNCQVGNQVIMSNNATLAGHVTVDDYAIVGGMTPIHQFVRIGSYAMVGGMSRVTKDVPPFTLGGGHPYKIGGLNLVGLKRRQFSLEARKALTKAFKVTYRSGIKLADALDLLRLEYPEDTNVKYWIDFCADSKRGLIDHSLAQSKEKALEEASL